MKKLYLILILFFLSVCFVSSTNHEVVAQDTSDDVISITDSNLDSYYYEGYSFQNAEKFTKYLSEVGYDIYDLDSMKYIIEKFLFIYFEAIELKKIDFIQDDALLGDYTFEELVSFVQKEFPKLLNDFELLCAPVSVKWHSDHTLDQENSGTHQVITRDALEVVTDLFPNFYIQNINGVYVTQCYSDYPDMFEVFWLNSEHFYNYNYHTNYFYNLFSSNNAKSMFLEHYNNAMELYMFNELVAMRELGAAIHYISDIGTPVHVGDGISPLIAAIALEIGYSYAAIYTIYCGSMIVAHVNFESYVEDIDETTEMDIPTNIDFDYYLNVNLSTLVENITAHSYQYYDEARSIWNSEKHEAAINTIPYIKEVIAGLLYRFAYNLNQNRQYDYDGVLIRNKYSGLYMTADSSTFPDGTNVMLDSIKADNRQKYLLYEYAFGEDENALNRYNSFGLVSNPTKWFDIVNGSGLDGANLQIYSQAFVPAQYYKPTIVSHSYGHYKILTQSSNYNKVLSTAITTPVVGTNVNQWSYVSSSYDQWYFDLLKTVNVNWSTNNLQEAYIHKGQYIYYKLVIPYAGNYVLETKSQFNTYLNLYDSNFNQIGYNDDSGDNYNAKISQNLSGGTYYVRMRMYYSTHEGRVNFVVYKSNQSTSLNLTSSGSTYLSISARTVYPIHFTAPTSKYYIFYTTGTANTFLTLYDSKMMYIGYNDDYNGDVNAHYIIYLNQGESINLFLRSYSPYLSISTTFVVA